MLLQYFIVFVILLLGVVYVIGRVRRTFRDAQGGCYGCRGCAIREQMMKKANKEGRKTRNFDCFKKKV